jgi:excinuclease UvrABC nuclease subunit
MKLKGLDQIHYFSKNLRRQDFENLSFSEDDLLDLCPEKENQIETKLDWRSDWPNASSHGVYLIYDEDLELIYVGTATNLGRRLYTYFGSGKKCELRQEWGREPR